MSTDSQPRDLEALAEVKVAKFGLRGMIGAVLAILNGLYCLPYTFIFPVIMLFMVGMSRARHNFVHWIVGMYLEMYVAAFKVKVVLDGEENFDPEQAYVFAPNHRSWLDAVAMVVASRKSKGRLGGLKFYFIIKHGLVYIPLYGLYMLYAGYITVRRRDKVSPGKREPDNNARVEAAVEGLLAGKSILIFPEGSRSTTHRFLSFRRGAATIASRANVPILPVAISGASALYPKGSVFMRPGTVRVEILPPVYPEGRDADEVTAEVYDAIARRYRLTWDGPPLEEDDELRAFLAPGHNRRAVAQRRGGG